MKVSSFSDNSVFCLMRMRERLPRTHTPTHSHPFQQPHSQAICLILPLLPIFFFLFFPSPLPIFFVHFALCFKGLNLHNSWNYTQIIQPKLSTHILGHFKVVIFRFELLIYTVFFFSGLAVFFFSFDMMIFDMMNFRSKSRCNIFDLAFFCCCW